MSAKLRGLLELAKQWERDADAHRQRLGRNSAQAQQACLDHARELREALANSRAQDSGGEAVGVVRKGGYELLTTIDWKIPITALPAGTNLYLHPAATSPPKVEAQQGVSIAYNALRSIRYNAENGSEDRPLHHRLHLISTEANKALAALGAALANAPQEPTES